MSGFLQYIFFLNFLLIVHFFMFGSSQCVMDSGVLEEEEEEREKGRVLGQVDRDVSTASVILWRARERQKKKAGREAIGTAERPAAWWQ